METQQIQFTSSRWNAGSKAGSKLMKFNATLGKFEQENMSNQEAGENYKAADENDNQNEQSK